MISAAFYLIRFIIGTSRSRMEDYDGCVLFIYKVENVICSNAIFK